MVSRKYLKDYRVESSVDINGRVRSEAIYIGGDYVISPSVPTGGKRLILSLCVLSWLCFVGALIPLTNTTRAIYVILPFAVSALTMYFMTDAAVLLLRIKEADNSAGATADNDVLTRAKAERIANRLPPCSILTAIFSAAAFIGGVVTAVIWSGSIIAGDIVFIALSLLISAASSVSFAKCRKIKAVKKE